MKKVSVIVPVHNSSKFIKECLESIINQNYDNMEIIIVDDFSTDDSLDIISSFDDSRFRVIKLDSNHGAAYARNIGVKVSSGDYICFLDSDDYWYLDKINKQVKFIKDKAFIYGGYAYLKRGRKHTAHVPLEIDYEGALKNTTIFTSTVMFNMKYLSKEDLYMPLIRREHDSATWWSILKKIDKAYGIDEVLSVYRVGEKSLSSNKIIDVIGTWRLYKYEGLPFFKRLYCFMCYGYNAIKRRIW